MTNLYQKFRENYHLPVILAGAFLMILPLILYGFPSGTVDLVHHVQLSTAYFDSLARGIWLPGFVAEENYGYGSVAVRFYPPLTHFAMGLFRLLTGGWDTAFILSVFFWSMAGGFGAYLLASDIFKNRGQAAAAAFISTLAHYRVNQLYNAFMFSEFVALSILPFTLLFAKRICERRKFYDVLGFGASVALLILSNLPQAVIGAVCVGIFVLFHLKKEDFFKQTARLAAGALIGLLCSSFYWIKLIGEMKWLNVYQPNTDPNYDFRNHFLLVSAEFDERGVWLVSAMFVALAIFLLISFAVSRNFPAVMRENSLKGLTVVFLVGSLLMLQSSTFVWENLVFLQRVQFPWRFLAVTSLCGAFLAAHSFAFLTRKNFVRQRPLAIILIGASFIYCLISVRQIATGARFIDAPQYVALFDESKSAEGLPHWWTTWWNKGAFEEKARVSAGHRGADVLVWENEYRRIRFDAGEPASMRVATFYYPHWQAKIDGAEVKAWQAEDGAIRIDLPPEKGEVELTFVEPQANLLAGKISFAAWIALLLAMLYGLFKNRKEQKII